MPTHAHTHHTHIGTHCHTHSHIRMHAHAHTHIRTHTHTTSVQHTNGGSLPVELAPTSLDSGLDGTGPMGGLLGVSESVEYMRLHNFTPYICYEMYGAIPVTFTQQPCEVQSTTSDNSMHKCYNSQTSHHTQLHHKSQPHPLE